MAEEFSKPDDIEHPWRIRPLLFYIWGHSYEFNGSWERLEKICETIGNRQDVWYVTNMEVIDYISAFNSLRRSANGSIIHNPTDVDIFVNVNGKNLIIKKGETIIID